MNISAVEHVIEFIRTFDASLDPDLWAKLTEEETSELHEALLAEDRVNILKEAADLAYVMTPLMGIVNALGDFNFINEERAKRYQNLIDNGDKKLAAALAIFGAEKIQRAIDLVHQSNMTKLDDNGKPIRREDGKILKGPNYKEPDLTELVAA